MPKKHAALSGHQVLLALVKSRKACPSMPSSNINGDGRIFSLHNEILENILDRLTIRDLKVLSATHQEFRVLIHRRLNRVISVKIPSSPLRASSTTTKPKEHQLLDLPKTLTSIADAHGRVYYLHIKPPSQSGSIEKVWDISKILNDLPSLRHLSLDVEQEDLNLGSANSAITHITYTFRNAAASLTLPQTFRAAITLPRLKCLELVRPDSLLKQLQRDMNLSRRGISIQDLSVISPCQAAMTGIAFLLRSIIGLQSVSFTFDEIVPHDAKTRMHVGTSYFTNRKLFSFCLDHSRHSLKRFEFMEAIESTGPVSHGWSALVRKHFSSRVQHVVIPSSWFLSERLVKAFPAPYMLLSVETIQVQFIFLKSHGFLGVSNDVDERPVQAIRRFMEAKKNGTLRCLKEIIWWFQLKDQDTRILKWEPRHLQNIRSILASAGISFRWVRAERLNDTPLESPFINEVGRYYGECETRVDFK